MSSVWTAQRRELMTPAERADMARRLASQSAARRQRQQQVDNAQRNAALLANTVLVTDGDQGCRCTCGGTRAGLGRCPSIRCTRA